MPIVKREAPSERFEKRYGDTWARVRNFPMLAALCNPKYVNHMDVSPMHFTKMLDDFASARWISEVPMDTKIFFYALELVCHRAGIPGILPDEFLPHLKKHMSTLTVAEKNDNMDGVSFSFRQCFLWDIPAFLDRYTRPGTLHLSTPAKPTSGPKIKPKPRAATPPAPGPKPPPKALRKRLAQHR